MKKYYRKYNNESGNQTNQKYFSPKIAQSRGGYSSKLSEGVRGGGGGGGGISKP